GVVGSSAKGVNNEDLTGQWVAQATYTNVPCGLVHWTFTKENYADQNGDATVSITKATAVITVTGFSGVYDGATHGVVSSSAKGVNNEDLAGLVIANTTYTNVPGGLIHWTFTNENYADQAGDATVTITKATAVITVTGFSGVYDSAAHGVVGSSAKGVNNEDLTGLSIAPTTYTNVPGGLIHWTFTNENYADQNGDATVTITKATATIVVNSYSVTYDGSPHTATSTATAAEGKSLTSVD